MWKIYIIDSILPNRKRPKLIGEPNWKNVSILYELSYWMNKKLKHNIDVIACGEKY